MKLKDIKLNLDKTYDLALAISTAFAGYLGYTSSSIERKVVGAILISNTIVYVINTIYRSR